MKGIVSMILAGTLAANFGFTGFGNEDVAYQQQQQASAAYEQVVPQIGDIVPLGMATTARAEIQQDVDAGVRQVDRSVRQLPAYVVKTAQKVEEHGIAALAYSDPVLKEQGRELGVEIGQGIRHFAVALGKDLVLAVKESGVRAR